jgi:hypothetical protein
VSQETIDYIHCTSKPIIDDNKLRLTLLSLRIIHALFHAIGFSEHVDLKSKLKENEAQKRGDPSLATSILETKCLMSWRFLAQLASAYDGIHPVLPLQMPICSKCLETPSATMGLGIEDFEMMLKAIYPKKSLAIKEKMSQQIHYRYYVLYVLQIDNSDVLLGLSPFCFDKNVKASTESTLEKIEDNLLDGFGLCVPHHMIDPTSTVKLEKGFKLLVEFQYSVDENNFLL